MPNNQLPLAGRVAVVTGASSGIGEAAAVALAADGASVALLARRADRLTVIAERIRAAGGTAEVYAVDITNPAGLAVISRRVARDLGPASIVFNNAGMMLPTPITKAGSSEWRNLVEINIGALNSVIAAFVPQLLQSAAEQGVADLINTASIAGKQMFPGFSVYAASKAYVIHLSNNLRAELGQKGVRVSTIEPGIVDTPLQSHIEDTNIRERLEATRQVIKWLLPEDVAKVVCFTVGLPSHVNLSEISILPSRQV